MPKLVSFRYGKRWAFTDDENKLIRRLRAQRVPTHDIALQLDCTPRAIHEQMKRLGITRKNNSTFDEVFNNKYDTLVQLSKVPDLTRIVICETLGVSDHFATTFRQVIEVIRAHEKLKERGINTKVSPRGKLTLAWPSK